MPGLFDDIPTAPTPRKQQAQPPVAGGLFDDIPTVAPAREPQRQPAAPKQAAKKTEPAKESPAASWLNFYRGLMRSTAQGATMGFADEGEAVLRKSYPVLNSGPLGYPAQLLQLMAARPGDANRDYEQVLEGAREEQRQFRTEHPIMSGAAEIGGGFVVPFNALGRLMRAGKSAPQAANFLTRAKDSAKVGGVYGGIAGFGTGEGDVENRLRGGVHGAAWGSVLAPVLSEAVVPGVIQTGKGIRATAKYADDALRAMRNPERAAVENVADSLVAANVNPTALRALVLQGEAGKPLLSPELTRRGFTDEHLSDVVSRLMKGESAATVAAEHTAAGRRVSPSTLQRYYDRYLQSNPTPMNVADMAQELVGPGGAKPVLRLGRQSYSLASDEGAGDAAARLMNRQIEQPGRIEQIVQGRSGRNFEDEIARLGGELKDVERIAYAEAHKQQQPFDLRPVLSAARARIHGRAGDIADKMQRAVDLFFKPKLAERAQAPMTSYRIGEARAALQRAEAKGINGNKLAQMRRRLRAMERQDEYSRPATARKLGEPIDDIARYIDARDELSHMTQTSFHEGKQTRLTEALTELRRALNRQIWETNPTLAAADLQFAGNRTAERLLDKGIRTGTSLTPATREAVREFRALTPPQQELYRVGFEQKIVDDALRTKKGAAAANQFQTEAFDRLIKSFYPREAGPEIYRRGQSILRNLRREAATTNTKNEFLAGARTAELSSDMERGKQAAETASAVLTMKLGKVWDQLANRLTTQLGQTGAAQALKILSTSDPAQLLPMLNRLSKAAQTSQERQAYVMAIRQVRRHRLDRLPAPIGIMTGDLVNRPDTATVRR